MPVNLKALNKILLTLIVVFSLAFTCTANLKAEKSKSKQQTSATKKLTSELDQGASKFGINSYVNMVTNIKDELTESNSQEQESLAEAESIISERERYELLVELNKREIELLKKEIPILQKEAQLEGHENALNKIELIQEKIKKLEVETSEAEKKFALLDSRAELAKEKIELRKNQTELKKKTFISKFRKVFDNRSISKKLLFSILIIALGIAIYVLVRYTIDKFEKSITPKNVIRESERLLHLKTLGNLFRWLNGIIVVTLVIFALMSNFGFDTTFLLAGAGIVGVAVGFGGQYLIRDIITGMFVIIEGQYRINDIIQVEDKIGLVEDINLRVTTMRDLEGRVIIVPNGEIKTVVNYTKGHAYALLDLGVSYNEKVDEIMEIITNISNELRQDDYFGSLILEELEMLGVDDFADSQILIKFRIKTLPIKQWEVAREFRRRIKNKFDELGIKLPYLQRTLHFDDTKIVNILKETQV
jgi:small conductance mechanosensitive channel